MIDGIATWVLEHRVAAVALLLGVVLSFCAGILQLSSDFSVEAFFGKGGQELVALHEFKDTWGPDDSHLLVLVSAGGKSLLLPKVFESVDDLARNIEALPAVASVGSITQSAALLGSMPGLLDLQPLIDALPQVPSDDPEWAKWSRTLLEHPTLVPALLSADGSRTALIVELRAGSDDIQALRPAVLELRTQIEILAANEGLETLLAGIPAVRAGFADLIFRDQLVAIPTIAVAILVLLLFLFRSAHGVLVPMLAALIPTLMTFGLLGWSGEPIGLANQVLVTLLPAIAVADAIHMIARFHEELHREFGPGETPSPDRRKRAIRTAMTQVGTACFLTSTTTGIGFLSLVVAGMPILQSFGIYAAIGIAFAYGTVLLIVPLALSLTRGPLPTHHRDESTHWSSALIRGSVDLSLGHPWKILAVTGLILGVGAYFGSQVVVDNVLTALLAEDHPTTEANRIVDRELGGVISVEVDLQGPPGVFKDPGLHQALDRVETWAEGQPEVRVVLSPTTYLRTLHRAITGQDGLPQSREAVAQLLLLGEGNPGLQSVLEVNDLARGRMTLRVVDGGGNYFIAVAQRIQDHLDAELKGQAITARVTGTPWIAYSGINKVTEDVRNSLALAFVVIAIIILVLFRSLRIALLCLIPNALPLVVGYALLGALDWPLDPTPAIVFTVVLGIAVDDTLHLMARYREELRRGQPHQEAIRHSVLRTGRAVLITSIILCVGFGANGLSSFPSMVVMAAVGAAGIWTALCSDLFLLPALLSLFAKPPEAAE